VFSGDHTKARDGTCQTMKAEYRRILIVDDEPAIARLLSSVFRRAGYVVRVASSGFEAMQVCECESFDALLSDVRMPGGINGMNWCGGLPRDTQTRTRS
jgi:CheY-like chemotaxis protein